MSESLLGRPSVWGWQGAIAGISQRIKHIHETGQQSDVQFVVGHQYGETEEFRAHKFILGISSEVFWTMFYGGVQETTETTIKLPDILPQAFRIMLKYVYTDVVEGFDWENVFPTMYCAQKYGIPNLVEICSEYTVKNVDKTTCLAVLEAAKDLDAMEVVDKCLEILDPHCGEVLQSDEFLSLKNGTLGLIFTRNSLVVNEEDLFRAAERWALEACRVNHVEPIATNVRGALGPVLFLIRFPLMDDRVLADGPAATGLLVNEEIRQLYQFKHGSKQPEIPFSATPRLKPTINFSTWQWIILDQTSKGYGMMAGSNAFLDEQGFLHLRLSQQDGVWKGAGIQLVGALACGRYEFHVQGRLDKLDPNIIFAMSSQAENQPGIAIQFSKWGDRTRNKARWGIWRRDFSVPIPIGKISTDQFDFSLQDVYTTHSYHWTPKGVSFSFQHGHQYNNTDKELEKWFFKYKTPKVMSQEPLQVSIGLCTYDNGAPSNGTEMEVIVHSFRFYTD